MEEKYSYYTPDIEEFHVGFEYEEDFMSGEGDWRKVTFEVKDDDLWHIPGKLEEGWIRVRHLCYEDIVGLGFKAQIKTGETGYGYNLIEKDGKSILTITDKEYSVLFKGTIRNRSELKRIMKMVGIEK